MGLALFSFLCSAPARSCHCFLRLGWKLAVILERMNMIMIVHSDGVREPSTLDNSVFTFLFLQLNALHFRSLGKGCHPSLVFYRIYIFPFNWD
jgi:phosphate starvation-inducible membrane PsiE